MPAITALLLDQGQHKDLFLNYTETLDEVSLLVDTRSYRALLRLLPASLSGLSSSASSFRAMSVSEGEIDSMVSFDVTTGLVSSLSRVLATAGISIFYFSTYQTDLVVIKAEQVERATDVLKQHFGEDRIVVEYDEQQGEQEQQQEEEGRGETDGSGDTEQQEPGACGDSDSSSVDCNAATYLPGPTQAAQAAATGAPVVSAAASASSFAPAAPSTPISPQTTMQLYSLPQEFILAHFTEAEITSHLKSLLQLFFFPPNRKAAQGAGGSGSGGEAIPDRFFSYSNIEREVSMQVDDASLAVLSADHGCDFTHGFERWRAFHVSGEFGFDECGIVAALSSPLTRNSICPFYLSTFFTDYFLVQEGKWEAARSILEKEFRFVERKRKPKSPIRATTTVSATAAAPSATAAPHAAVSIAAAAATNPYAAPLSSADLTGGVALQTSSLQRGLSTSTDPLSSEGHAVPSTGAYLHLSSADIAPSFVPILQTTSSSKSHSASSVSSAYDAVPSAQIDSAQPVTHAASPYASMDTADMYTRAPAPAVKPQAALSLFSAASLALPSVPAAAAPAAPASSDPAFDALFAPVQMGSVRSSPSASAAPSAAAAAAAAPPAASLDTLAIESLACYRPRVDKDSVTALLRVSDAAAVPAAPASYSSHDGGAASDASLASSPSAQAGHGLFLLRMCTDPAELLPSGAANPDLFVLCYNRHGKQVKSKVYRVAPPHAPAPALSLGSAGSGHRLFPSLQALVSAVVGPQARPIA